jgi:hypothetical protein
LDRYRYCQALWLQPQLSPSLAGSLMNTPLVEQLSEKMLSRGRYFNAFKPNGPRIEHRKHPYTQLLIPCDLSNLDACLQRLPQDKPRMGFRVNLNDEPWMLRPSGNWGTAKISRKDNRRLGWANGDLYVHPDGICLGLTALGSSKTYFSLDGSNQLPVSIRKAQVIAGFCEKLNADPSGLREYGLDSSTNCMCCGKALSVDKSKVRGVGPECLSYMERFLGLGTEKTIAEMEKN